MFQSNNLLVFCHLFWYHIRGGDAFSSHCYTHHYQPIKTQNLVSATHVTSSCICLVVIHHWSYTSSGIYPSTINNKTDTTCYLARTFKKNYHKPTKIFYIIQINHPLSNKSQILV